MDTIPSGWAREAFPTRYGRLYAGRLTMHNGYLDLWLQLGLLGVVLFAVSFITSLFKAIALIRRENGWIEMFPLLFLIFMAIHNITESTILFRNQISWILYVLISIQLRSGFENDVCNTTCSPGRKNNENC
jgi:O-antigen ligase